MLELGTRSVAGGPRPARAGEQVHGVPSVRHASPSGGRDQANASVIYVPAPFAADAIYEAADAGSR
jgi:succinyl-CoA synthetase alpha subunit